MYRKNVPRRGFDEEVYKENIKRRQRVAVITILVLVPALLAVFYFFMRQRHYILVSFLLVAAVILPFFVMFEYRKPRARDVVLTSSMTALTVASNIISSHTIPVHAGTAMVVITGISLGPETGFLVGALARLICNIFDGQGPWTPWQMACWGLMGFISGLAFNRVDIKSKSIFEETTSKPGDSFKLIMGPVISIAFAEMLGFAVFIATNGNKQLTDFLGWWLYGFGALGLVAGIVLQRKKLPADMITMTAFTFFICFIVYGGVMNFAALLMDAGMNPESQSISGESIRLVYVTGVPYDFTHALGASMCIFFFGENIIQKIQRIKIKFGLI